MMGLDRNCLMIVIRQSGLDVFVVDVATSVLQGKESRYRNLPRFGVKKDASRAARPDVNHIHDRGTPS
jgi:hypothetical protein